MLTVAEQLQHPYPGGMAKCLEEVRLQLVQRRAHSSSLPNRHWCLVVLAPVRHLTCWPSMPQKRHRMAQQLLILASLTRGGEAGCGSADPMTSVIAMAWPTSLGMLWSASASGPAPPAAGVAPRPAPTWPCWEAPGSIGVPASGPQPWMYGSASRPAPGCGAAWTLSTPTAAACPG